MLLDSVNVIVVFGEKKMNVRQFHARRNARLTPSSEVASTQSRATWSNGRMYAISFDLDQGRLQAHYPGNTHTNAYDVIRRVFCEHGFNRVQGSVYFNEDRSANPVSCVLAVQDLVRRHPWFKYVVSDIRMLRIEEDNDLMPAVGEYRLPLSGSAAE